MIAPKPYGYKFNIARFGMTRMTHIISILASLADFDG